MNVILSIKPQFVAEIIAGRKTFEFRKKVFKQPVNKVYIYSSAPICKLVGEFTLGLVVSGNPSSVWRRTNKQAGISKKFFDTYFSGKTEAFALEICAFKKYKNPVEASSVVPNFTPPQSYRYVEDLDLR